MNELDFLDIVILSKIDENSSLEKFHGVISTSFFETANIFGTMKVKGLVDFQPSLGGQSKILLTALGEETLRNANLMSNEELDGLDDAILRTIGGGSRDMNILADRLNVRNADLAFHLQKLYVQQYVDYQVAAGKVSLFLSGKGFNKAGAVPPAQAQQPAEAPVPAAAQQAPEYAPEPEASAPAPPSQHPATSSLGAELSAAEKDLPIGTKRAISKLEYYFEKYLLVIMLLAVLILCAALYLVLKVFGMI